MKKNGDSHKKTENTETENTETEKHTTLEIIGGLFLIFLIIACIVAGIFNWVHVIYFNFAPLTQEEATFPRNIPISLQIVPLKSRIIPKFEFYISYVVKSSVVHEFKKVDWIIYDYDDYRYKTYYILHTFPQQDLIHDVKEWLKAHDDLQLYEYQELGNKYPDDFYAIAEKYGPDSCPDSKIYCKELLKPHVTF